MAEKTLILFSGGQDSTTCLYWAIEKFASELPREKLKDYIFPVTFNYGQRHEIEIESAKAICKQAALNFDQVDIPNVLRASSSLTDKAVNLPEHNDLQDFPDGIQSTFVPARNILFLTVAANIAMSLGAKNIVTGVCETDFAGYYDCRQDFIDAMQLALNQGCYGQDQGFAIYTPLMYLDKAQTVKLAQKLGEDCLNALAYSHTCYNGSFPPCGKCHSCHLRAKGFREAGIPDPLVERSLI